MVNIEDLKHIVDVSQNSPELAVQLLRALKYSKWQAEVLVYLFERFNIVEKVTGSVEDDKKYIPSLHIPDPIYHVLSLNTTCNTTGSLYGDTLLYPYNAVLFFISASIKCDFWYKTEDQMFKTSFVFDHKDKIKNPLQTLYIQIVKQ